MKTTRQDRLAAFTRIIAYLNEHLNETDPVFIDRTELCNTCQADTHIAARALLMLETMGYIKQERRSHYVAAYALKDVTSDQIEAAQAAYSTEANKRSQERKANQPAPEPVAVAASTEPYQMELALTDSFDSREPVFGYHIASGIAWFDSPEQAAIEGQNQALLHNLKEVTLIRKMGVVEIQKPIIRML